MRPDTQWIPSMWAPFFGMQQRPANPYVQHVLFPSLGQKTRPQKFLWIALFVAFLIADAPPARISGVVLRTLQVVPQGVSGNLLAQNENLQQLSREITSFVFVPLKELLFLLALIIISHPIIRCVIRGRDFWRELVTKQTVLFSLRLFLGLLVLVFPYSYPYGRNSHPSGLAGLGVTFGRMSVAPFQEWNPLYYKRLLKPAIAHFIHLDGYFRYYLFSLVCTYILIFLVVAFWQSKFFGDLNSDDQLPSLNAKAKWIVYLSVMTSSFMLINFQRPGYSDHLSYILVLLMAIIPMTSQARLATVGLCLLNHEGIALALIPVILFCFPKGERITALMAVALFYGVIAAGYGFSATRGLESQGAIRDDAGSVWEAALHGPELFLAGVFFAYKLLWIPFALAIWMLWKQREMATLSAIAAITLFPLSLTLFAWDTTRVAGFGWLGMLIALGLVLREYKAPPRVYHYAMLTLACVNLVIPTYNVIIYYKDSLSNYFDPGLYMFFIFAARRLLT
jgi:hypothetical protein